MTYQELLAGIQEMAGQRVPANLPFLIRQAEDQLWAELWFCGKQVLHTEVLPAGTKDLSLTGIDPGRIIMFGGVMDKKRGVKLRRVSLSEVVEDREIFVSQYPVTFAWDGSLVRFSNSPAEDLELEFVLFLKDEPLKDGDTGGKFFLEDGASVLMHYVLYRNVFDPDRWQQWKRNFHEDVAFLERKYARLAYTYRGGTINYDAIRSY